MQTRVFLVWWLAWAWVVTLGSGSIALAGPDSQPAGKPAAADNSAVSAEPPAKASRKELVRWLEARIDGLVAARPALGSARVGIVVEEPISGKALYRRNADERFNVASNTKVITAAAALALLGPDFRHRTAVLAEAVDAKGEIKGNLYLRGRGAPDLGLGDLERLADELVQAGVTSVRGTLVVDDTYFDGAVLPPHFGDQPNEQAAFRAPVSALALERNAFTVVVRPALSGQGPATVLIEPPNEYIRVVTNQLVTQLKGRDRVQLSSTAKKDRMEVVLSGQIRAGAAVQRYRLRVEDPVLFAGHVFRALLAERKIRIRKKGVTRGATPAKVRLLGSVDSAPLAVQVRRMGKDSDNFVAEMVLKTIGAESRATPGPATWDDGVARVRRYLSEAVGMAPGSFRYDNGSGLFDATELSPAQIARVLTTAWRDPRVGPELAASLAIAGIDGTLRRRMLDTPAQGMVRAKTGTLATASALAGYAAVDTSQPLVFAVAINDMPRKGDSRYAAMRDARSLQDEIAAALVLYLRASAQAKR